jgi:protein TonB
MARRDTGSRLTAPITLSALLHAAVATLLFFNLREQKPVALPPMYRVNIVAAPPGERAIGEVTSGQAKPTTSVTQPTTAPSTIKEAPAPTRTRTPAVTPRANTGAAKTTTAKAATPTTGKTAKSTTVTPPADTKVNDAKTAAPKAGGGPTGGKGTDVATVRSEGIEFPFQGISTTSFDRLQSGSSRAIRCASQERIGFWSIAMAPCQTSHSSEDLEIILSI